MIETIQPFQQKRGGGANKIKLGIKRDPMGSMGILIRLVLPKGHSSLDYLPIQNGRHLHLS